MTSPAIKKAVEKRSAGICEGCGTAEATEIHHRKYRSRGGLDNLGNLLHLCGWGNHTGCHGRAHSDAPPQGWSIHSWDDPLLVPAALHAGTFYLTNDGGLLPIGEIPPF